jgi:hypothetical protein
MRPTVFSALVSLAIAFQFGPQLAAAADLSQWFKGLKQPGTGMSCCDISDCQAVTARMGEMGYEIFIDGQWRKVPDDKILQGQTNPLGRAVACYTPRQGIMCFVRPMES